MNSLYFFNKRYKYKIPNGNRTGTCHIFIYVHFVEKLHPLLSYEVFSSPVMKRWTDLLDWIMLAARSAPTMAASVYTSYREYRAVQVKLALLLTSVVPTHNMLHTSL